MPLITSQPTVPKEAPIAQTPALETEVPKSTLVDISNEALDSLLIHADGSKWRVDYYRQLLAAGDEPTQPQFGQLKPYQQYEKIVDLPLRVDSTLSESIDEQNNLVTVTGSSHVVHGVVPNVGDVFTAYLADGRKVMFAVSAVKRSTLLRAAVHTIDYLIVAYDDPDLADSLNANVVRELVYSDNHVGSVDGPVITSQKLDVHKRLTRTLKELKRSFYKRFYNSQTTSYILPVGGKMVYDHALSRLLDKLISRHDLGNPLSGIPLVLSVGGEKRHESYTIWDTLTQGNISQLFDRVATYTIEKPTLDPSARIYNHVALYPVDSVVVPDAEATSHYVFSEAFYAENIDEMDALELLVYGFIKGEILDPVQLLEMVDTASSFTKEQAAYHWPVLMILINSYLRSV